MISFVIFVAMSTPKTAGDVFAIPNLWTLNREINQCLVIDHSVSAQFSSWKLDNEVSDVESGVYALTDPKDRSRLILLFRDQRTCETVNEIEPSGLRLRKDEYGVVYVLKRTKGRLKLRLVFPASTVMNFDPLNAKSGESVDVLDELIVFDSKGALGTITSVKRMKTVLWCENDGGMQFRPEIIVDIPASKLRRRLKPNQQLQRIAAFVRVGLQVAERGLAASNKAAMHGDLDADGRPEVQLWTAPDDAQNCSGKPQNDLTISLVTRTGDAPLRCCGP